MIFLKAESYRAIAPDTPCVLLDGCFDPLHQGHVQYVRQAQVTFPDAQIVVSVAADAEIRAKGREPLFGQMTRAAIVDGLLGVDVVLVKDQPTDALIAALKPLAYVKGADWKDALPPEQIAACVEHAVQMVFLNTVVDSSTDRLRLWAASEDAKHLEALEGVVANQKPASEPWQPVTDYSFEARKEIEGIHPQLIKEVFQPKRVWDVGCGPGFMVVALRELGVKASGFDTKPPRGVRGTYHADISVGLSDEDDGRYFGGFSLYGNQPDLVICREVLEHLTIQQIRQAVTNLCEISRRFVYVTTRFTKAPAHLLKVDTADDLDPTHITMLNQDFLRTLFVLNGGKRRKDLETKLDWQSKGRVLVYEV